jgi:phosphopentomutase
MGVVTPQPMPTYPHGFPHDVIDPFMHQTGRGVLGNKAGVGHGDHPGARRGASAHGQVDRLHVGRLVFQIAAHEETIPLEELYDGCRIAREILTGKHASARDRAAVRRNPGNYERTSNRPRLLARAERPNYLTLVRDAG